MDARQLGRHVEGVTASHRGLEAMLGDLRDGLDAAAPSRLPDWTIGHVLAHLARNADSISRVLEATERGETVERYAGGPAGRNAEITAGAPRPAGDLIADVHDSNARLEAVLAVHTRWDGISIETSGRRIGVGDLVFLRWREVEVHRADLGLGYGPDDWPAEYVRTELVALEMQWRARRPMGLTALPPEALATPDRVRLAWLLGRAEIAGLAPANVL